MNKSLLNTNLSQFLLENSFVGVHLVDVEGIIRYICPQIEQMLGYTAEEMIGKKCWDFIYKDDIKYLRKATEMMLKGFQKETELELRLVHKNGKIKFFYNKMHNFLDNNIGFVTTYFQEITEKKEEEYYIEQTQQYLQAILDHTQYGFFLLTPSRKVLYFNATAYEIISQSEENLKMGDDFLDYVSSKNRTHFLESFEKCLLGENIGYERKIPMPDGTERWLDFMISPIYFKKNEIYGVSITLTDMTARKMAEMSLLKSEKTLQAIFNNSAQIAFLVDKEYKIIALNRYATKVTTSKLGKTAKIGDNFFEFVEESQKEEVKQRILHCLEGNYLRIEREMNLVDSKQWLEIFYAPIENENKEYFAVNIAMFSISERKNAEEKLRYSEKLYQTIAENFPKSNVNVFDKNFKLIFTQGQLYKYMDLVREDFMNKTIYEIFSTRTNLILEKNMKDALKGISTSFEHRNKLGIFLVNTLPLTQENQNDIENILVIFQDITEIKEKEKNLEQLNHDLDEQNQVLKNKEEQLLALNEELTVSNEHLILQQEVLTEINDKLNRQRNILESVNIELELKNETLLNREGELREAYQKILNQQNEMHFSLTEQQSLNEQLVIKNQELASQEEELRSINEQLRLQQDEMKITLAQLSDRNFELDQLVYRTSHDIRSPLTSILGLVNIMRLEGLPDNLAEYVDRMEMSVQKLDRFVNSMLNFAKVNRTERKSEPISFEDIILKCEEDFRYMPHFDRVTQKYVIKNEKAIQFYGDILRLEIIFANIISNAIKYQDLNKENNTLDINIVFEDGYVNIVFEDNGIGIKEEYIKKIFDMFFRATDKGEGSGLGLYIVKQTIEKLGGSIKVKSEYGKGTLMNILLPNSSK
ncbi:MAG: PAS domain S-box protein [Bacteroidetes bacterium]|nr:MAG: PAS domain S-box protein [Bacteroidota bacterium]TAG87151.1 MAG: PAS domain S-box protein [Bacteroidota bacterium]